MFNESNQKYKKNFKEVIKMVKNAKPCPGSKIRSKGRGRGLGVGKGQGPIGVPAPSSRRTAPRRRRNFVDDILGW